MDVEEQQGPWVVRVNVNWRGRLGFGNGSLTEGMTWEVWRRRQG